MTEDNWKTLRVPPEAYEQAKEQKEKHGRTWGEQLVCDNATTMEVIEAGEVVEELSHEDTLAERLERIEQAAKEATNAAQAAERATEALQQ